MKKFIFFGILICTLALTSGRAIAQSPSTGEPTPLGLCLENYAYPYPVKYITLHIQQQTLKMAYMEVTPAKPNGHSILLLHGKNFCGAYWGQTAAALAGEGFRVIIPDQIGFGKSSKPATLEYSFQLLARNTKALLDSLQIEKISVLGHSMGGMLATRFALMYPGIVEKFILEDPIGLEDWKVKVPYRTIDEWFQVERHQTYASLKKYEMTSYFHGAWSPGYDQWLNIPAGWTLSPEYDRIAWNSALTYDMIFTQPVCYEFGNIKTPTLLIIGQLDRTALGKDMVPDSIRQTLGNYPVLGRLTHEKIKDSRLVELPGIGHVPHVEAFQLFIRPLLDFLK